MERKVGAWGINCKSEASQYVGIHECRADGNDEGMLGTGHELVSADVWTASFRGQCHRRGLAARFRSTLSQEAVLRERLLEIVTPCRQVGVRVSLNVAAKKQTSQ